MTRLFVGLIVGIICGLILGLAYNFESKYPVTGVTITFYRYDIFQPQADQIIEAINKGE